MRIFSVAIFSISIENAFSVKPKLIRCAFFFFSAQTMKIDKNVRREKVIYSSFEWLNIWI